MGESNAEEISWYNLPFYRALTETVMFLGVPRNVIVVNGIVSFMFVMYFHFVYILALSVVVHFVCIKLCSDDAQFFDCLSLRLILEVLRKMGRTR